MVVGEVLIEEGIERVRVDISILVDDWQDMLS